MKALKPITAPIEANIAVNRYQVDEENAHIELASKDLSQLDAKEFGKLVRICPAGLYREDEAGKRSFDYAGCLECGTCRIACEDTIISKWENPAPMMGVSFRFA